MNNKIMLVTVAVVIGGVAFFGGMKYGQATAASNRSALRAQFGVGGGNGTGDGRQFNGTFGQVIAKSNTSITVKLMDGSSRIVFVSGTTPVMKLVAGSLNDIAVGTNVAVTGATNSDGSVTASQIQIRPAMTPRPSPTQTK